MQCAIPTRACGAIAPAWGFRAPATTAETATAAWIQTRTAVSRPTEQMRAYPVGQFDSKNASTPRR